MRAKASNFTIMVKLSIRVIGWSLKKLVRVNNIILMGRFSIKVDFRMGISGGMANGMISTGICSAMDFGMARIYWSICWPVMMRSQSIGNSASRATSCMLGRLPMTRRMGLAGYGIWARVGKCLRVILIMVRRVGSGSCTGMMRTRIRSILGSIWMIPRAGWARASMRMGKWRILGITRTTNWMPNGSTGNTWKMGRLTISHNFSVFRRSVGYLHILRIYLE